LTCRKQNKPIGQKIIDSRPARCKSYLKIKTGFSFIELIVVAGILGLVFLMAIKFFIESQKVAAPKITSNILLQMKAQKTADAIILRIRECSEVVRPNLGETCPFVVMKDERNRICILYSEADEKNSRLFKKKLYRLVSYISDYSGVYNPAREKILVDSLDKISFTSISPCSVQVTATVSGEEGKYQFITHVGLMNLGNS